MIFISCNSDTPRSETNDNKKETTFFSPDQLPIYTFEIDNTKDTILEQNGLRLHLPKNSFLDQNGKPVQLITITVKTALTLEDMIKGGLSTIDDQGRVLSSGGMFYWDAKSAGQFVKPKEEAAVFAEVPTDVFQVDMRAFSGKLVNGNIVWTNPQDFRNQVAIDSLKLGKALFLQYCAACHSQKIEFNMTGPRLINITKHRSRDWLIRFTRNSSKMVKEEDPFARCVYAEYNNQLMTSMSEDVSDAEINAIYDWIESESKWINKPDLKPTCTADNVEQRLSTIDSLYKIQDSQRRIYQDSLAEARDSYGNGNSTDTNLVVLPAPKYYQILMANQVGWINIDKWPKFSSTENLVLAEIQSKKDLFVQMFVIVPNRKIVLRVTPNSENVLVDIFNQKEIELPVDEDIILISRVEGEQKLEAAIDKLTITRDSEPHKIELKKITDKQFNQKLKKLLAKYS
ncbi:MAG: cytochrome c [Saprospiraceae bacterium]|nr:cytochrome c [Saprospiraceae bacterium]